MSISIIISIKISICAVFELIASVHICLHEIDVFFYYDLHRRRAWLFLKIKLIRTLKKLQVVCSFCLSAFRHTGALTCYVLF